MAERPWPLHPSGTQRRIGKTVVYDYKDVLEESQSFTLYDSHDEKDREWAVTKHSYTFLRLVEAYEY